MSEPTTPGLVGLHHFAFTVRDLDASIAWYQKVFQTTPVEGTFPHYGRERTGYALLMIEPHTGITIGLHHNEGNQGEEFDEKRTGLDHIGLQVEGRDDLQAWADWLDTIGVAHSGIQRVTDPSTYSTIVFRDLDNIQLEFMAPDV